MRKRYQEAKSLGFYVILFTALVVFLSMFIWIITTNREITLEKEIFSAIIGAAGGLIGFVATIFALYFTFNINAQVKEILLQDGFYMQVPRDMIRTACIFGLSIVSSIICYMVVGVTFSIFSIFAILSFITGLILTVYFLSRFFKIMKRNHLNREEPK